MRISIIIPVYNVEKYIEKCILSLQQQDIEKSDYEIIIINDGSPDNSREIILQLMQQFNNIVFIDQPNKGVSLARNAGIDIAVGKYLLFIDPDDYVVPNTFARVLKTTEDQQAQVSFLGFRFLNADNSFKKEILFAHEKGNIYPGVKFYAVSRGDGTTDPDRSWAILYERNFINMAKLRYFANVPYLEDGEFIARVLCLAERCIFEGGAFYIRTTRLDSATNSNVFFSEKAIDGFFNAANNLKQFKATYPLTETQRYFLNQPITKFTLLTVQACIGKGFYGKYRRIKERLKQNGLNKIDLKGNASFYYKYGLIFNLSNDLFYHIWTARLVMISISNKLHSLFSKN